MHPGTFAPDDEDTVIPKINQGNASTSYARRFGCSRFVQRAAIQFLRISRGQARRSQTDAVTPFADSCATVLEF